MPDERISYEIKKNTVQYVTFEKWMDQERITVEYRLQNNKYKIAKILRTNREKFFKDASRVNTCRKDDWKFGISEVIDGLNKEQFLDTSTCINGSRALMQMRGFLNPDDAAYGKPLLECINGLSVKSTKDVEKKMYAEVKNSIQALMIKEKQSKGTTIKIHCTDDKEKKNAEGSCSPKTGLLTISNSIDFTDNGPLKQKFLHELVHLAHGLSNETKAEEALADKITGICFDIDWESRIGKKLKTDSIIDADRPDSPLSETASQTQNTDIAKPAEAIPVQTVDVKEVGDLSKLASSTAVTAPENSTATNSALQSMFDGPNTAFGNATTAIARASIAPAYAGSGTGSSGSTRVPNTSSGPSPKYSIVEQIIVPTDKPNTYNVTTLTYATPEPATIGSSSPPTSRAPASSAVVGIKAFSQGTRAGNSAATDSSSGYSGPSFDASSGKSGNPNIPLTKSVLPVGGVVFSQNNVTDDSYKKYLNQISKPEFRKQLEEAGILISKDQTLLSKPKEVKAFYKDTGKALVYGGP